MSDHTLKGYKEFSAIRTLQVKPEHLGMHGRTARVNRLNARVKMAKSFTGMQLDGFREKTVAAYTSMFRVFLAFTAFEVFGYLMDCKPYEFVWKYPGHPYDEVAQTIRNCDGDWSFTDSLIEMLEEGGTMDALADFKVGNKNNPLNYALAIRHCFAHGRLTAHTGGSDPDHVRIMCDALAELMIRVMDEEFSRLVLPRYEKYVEDGVL